MNYPYELPTEVIKIIEGGLEGDIKKVRSYAELLSFKCEDRTKKMINRRLDSSYKTMPQICGRVNLDYQDDYEPEDETEDEETP